MAFFLKEGSSSIAVAERSTSRGDLYRFSMDPHMGMGQPHGRFIGLSESGLHSFVMRELTALYGPWWSISRSPVSLGERDTVSGSMYLSTAWLAFYHIQLGVV